MISQFCKSQIKCMEDTEDTWTCTAHLDSGRAFKCPYSPANIKCYALPIYISPCDVDEIMTFDGYYVGRCMDWEKVIPEPVTLPKELFEI
jgi:hypothetical protein